ncbi:MAG: Gfo/Idh/MocA family oxidoreductase [Nitrospira sp.]|nr:Gfo/Idh/MocA family oxidoreductase [Nitrospira sp.]
MRSGKPINVGLVGCGWFAQAVHLPILRRLPGVKLAALAEPDPDRRREASRCVPAAVAYADYRDLLKMRALDAVIVSVPTALHAEVAIAAMQEGKPVYLEKPIAISVLEADRVIQAWGKAGVVGVVGFNYRFNPLHEAARRHIDAGRLGPLVEVRSVFSTPPRDMPAWKRDRSTGGGVLLDLASHHIDLVRFLFQQEIRAVQADLYSCRTDQDTATLDFQLIDGLKVRSSFSLCACDEDRFEIDGQLGSVTVDRYRSLSVEITARNRPSTRVGRIAHILTSPSQAYYAWQKWRSPWNEPSYRRSLQAFVSAVQGQQVASPDLMDGYRSLEVIEAAEESAQTGRVVDVTSSLHSGSLVTERTPTSGESP